MFVFAMFMSLCVDVMVMSSAYVINFWGVMGPDYSFLDKPAMRTRWMAGNATHKSVRCRDQSRSDHHTQTSLDLRYLPQTNTS